MQAVLCAMSDCLLLITMSKKLLYSLRTMALSHNRANSLITEVTELQWCLADKVICCKAQRQVVEMTKGKWKNQACQWTSRPDVV